MSILCRLGLHSWKPVMRLGPLGRGWLIWSQTGHKCRRACCGKRVAL